MHARPVMPARWRRLITAMLAWLLVAQAIGWSTHALTHVDQAVRSRSEHPATDLAGVARVGPTDVADSVDRDGGGSGPVTDDGGGSLPAEHGCGLCNALNQGALALIPWPMATVPAPPSLGSATPICPSDGHGRPPVHHQSRAPPVPFLAA